MDLQFKENAIGCFAAVAAYQAIRFIWITGAYRRFIICLVWILIGMNLVPLARAVILYQRFTNKQWTIIVTQFSKFCCNYIYVVYYSTVWLHTFFLWFTKSIFHQWWDEPWWSSFGGLIIFKPWSIEMVATKAKNPHLKPLNKDLTQRCGTVPNSFLSYLQTSFLFKKREYLILTIQAVGCLLHFAYISGFLAIANTDNPFNATIFHTIIN